MKKRPAVEMKTTERCLSVITISLKLFWRRYATKLELKLNLFVNSEHTLIL